MKNQLGIRTLEQRRADAREIMPNKIVHGLVAIPLPQYFEQPSRMTRHSHPLAPLQIHTSVYYYKYSSFPVHSFFNTVLFPNTFCAVALRRNPTSRNPREGVLQYILGLESMHLRCTFRSWSCSQPNQLNLVLSLSTSILCVCEPKLCRCAWAMAYAISTKLSCSGI